MKLILTQEVTGLGAPGDVVEVKDGYGRNYLMPRGLGIRWTRGAEKTVESIKAARASRAVRDHDHAAQIKAKLESAPVSVKVRAGEGGRLFGAVTVSEIAGALAETSGEQVDKRTIVVDNPIKSLGAHEVSVKLHDEVSATESRNVIPACRLASHASGAGPPTGGAAPVASPGPPGPARGGGRPWPVRRWWVRPAAAGWAVPRPGPS